MCARKGLPLVGGSDRKGRGGAGGSDLRRKEKSTEPPGEGGKEEAAGAGQGAEGRGQRAEESGRLLPGQAPSQGSHP